LRSILFSLCVHGAVRGDCVRIRQVLVSLIGNALKFTEAGGISVDLTSDADDPLAIKFSVRDIGIGISIEKQELIFQAFSQADSSTTRRFGGTGLGLTICSRLVNGMGGRMWVERTVAAAPSNSTLPSWLLPRHSRKRAATLRTAPLGGPAG
jgi:signal transduction histidine kinase